MDPLHHCHRDGPCPCPPHPDLASKLRASIAAGDGGAQSILAPAVRSALLKSSQPTYSILGLNDGAVIPPSKFPDGASMRSMRLAALERAPAAGPVRTIIVLANFSDVKMGPGKVEFFKDLFFSTNKIPTGSVNDYYKQASGGAVSFTGEVIGPVTLPRKMTEYANGQSGITGSEPNTQTMARDALNAIKDAQNLLAYDNNGDTFVDTFVVVHAGGGAEQGGDPNKIWSVQWNILDSVRVGEVSVYAFLTIPEDCSLGLACHELGHLVFSWPDLYDGDKPPNDSEGTGRWCLMGSGSWNGSPAGSRPAHPSAWCKAKQGWVKTIVDVENGSITLKDVKTSGEIHRLWKNGDANSKEYFLLENRQQTKYDADLPGNGLLVWHIDDDQPNNRDQLHYKVGLEQADGLNQLATNRYGRGDTGDPFPGSSGNVTFNNTSNPNSKSYDQKETLVSITRISNSAETMTMDVTVQPESALRLFTPVFAQGDPGRGIGGYDLKSTSDRIFALDYNSTGKMDHLALYRPGTGTCWILRNQGGVFSAVYAQGDPGNGIGGYDLKSPNDVGFAFDYESKGKLDHIVFYRPGTGAVFIMKKDGAKYAAVYAQGQDGSGIGGYDLRSLDDRMFAFDYNRSGRMDHLALYRPGTGMFWILKKATDGKWSPVYQQGDPGNGIGGYDLRRKGDRVFAFDWESSGKMDHLALYRPGTGTFWILKKATDGKWSPVYQQGDPGNGVGGYDLRSPADVAMAYDWDHSGKQDHIALHRPGTGTLWVLKHLPSGGFQKVYAEGGPGKGLGGYDLKSPQDKLLTFDYESSGKNDYLVAYRTNGSGTAWILKHNK